MKYHTVRCELLVKRGIFVVKERFVMKCSFYKFVSDLTCDILKIPFPFSQCSREDISEKLRKDMSTTNAVIISNPKTLDFQVSCCLQPEIQELNLMGDAVQSQNKVILCTAFSMLFESLQ